MSSLFQSLYPNIFSDFSFVLFPQPSCCRRLRQQGITKSTLEFVNDEGHWTERQTPRSDPTCYIMGTEKVSSHICCKSQSCISNFLCQMPMPQPLISKSFCPNQNLASVLPWSNSHTVLPGLAKLQVCTVVVGLTGAGKEKNPPK